MPYRNSEKRKEKSRDAARSRRGKESEVFSALSLQLPITPNVLNTLDKASVMRVAISHLKIRRLLGPAPKASKNAEINRALRQLDQQYMKALDGVVLVIAKEGDMVFLSENCSKHLGLTQIELIGQSIYDFAHPCDHDEIREVLEKTLPTESNQNRDFFMRLKCTLTSKGKNINLKSATYKVMNCRGKCVTVDPEITADGAEAKGLTCLVVVAEPIPHPSNIEVPLDHSTFLTTHNMNMTFSYCDPRLEERLGYCDEDVQDKSMFQFFHAGDHQQLHKAFTHLINKGQSSTGVYRFLAKNGGYVFVETQATVIYNMRTEKPEHIVCVNYIISGVLEPDLILSDVQYGKSPVPVTKMETPAITTIEIVHQTEEDNVILATESIFTKTIDLESEIFTVEVPEDDEAIEDIAYRAPTAGDVMISLDYNNDEPKLVGVDSLLRSTIDENEADSDDDDPLSCKIRAMSPKSDTDSVMPQSTVSSVGSPPGLAELSSDTDNETHSEMANTVIIDPEQIDMAHRAPYISMSGDDDLIFSQETPGLDFAGISNVMLGKTESVFNPLPEESTEDEGDDKKKKSSVPISILRQQAMHQAKRRDSAKNQQNAQPNVINKPTETNRLETGPPSSPPAKRSRLLSTKIPSQKQREQEARTVSGGSSVLLNLLLKGEDKVNGYAIPSEKSSHLYTLLTESSSSSSGSDEDDSDRHETLRDLLTCPMSPMPSSSSGEDSPPILPAVATTPLASKVVTATQQQQPQYITFNPDIMQVLGLTSTNLQ